MMACLDLKGLWISNHNKKLQFIEMLKAFDKIPKDFARFVYKY